MSDKERLRSIYLAQVKGGQLTLKQASEVMNVSYRQAKRLWRRYKISGDAGLVHCRRGMKSNRCYPDKFKREVLAYYVERLEGFGPTFACEKLALVGFIVDHETLRRWLLAEGLLETKRKRSIYRQRRERRHRFGELVQMDGSFHNPKFRS